MWLQNKIETNGGGLRVLEEMLRNSYGREPAAPKRSDGATSIEAASTPAHAHVPSDHPHTLPLL